MTLADVRDETEAGAPVHAGQTRAAALRAGAAALAAAGVPGARLDARVLLGAVLDVAPAALGLDPEELLNESQAQRFAGFLAARRARAPVARILGTREFWSLPFALDAATLDPRPDSETLVQAVLDRRRDRTAALRVLDLGTGSGCLLLALLHEYPFAWGLGVDRDPAAAVAARGNAARLGLAGRAAFVAGDWDDTLAQRFDVAVVNPPYLTGAEVAAAAPEVRDHDPRAALDGGADGLAAYRALATRLAGRLTPGGLAAVEVGAGQAAAVAGLLRGGGLDIAAVVPDLAGVERCLIATPSGARDDAREK